MLFTGLPVLLDGPHPLGGYQVVRVKGAWRLREIGPLEQALDPRSRRWRHRCPVYGLACGAASAGDRSPACGGPARLYAHGPRCRGHEDQRLVSPVRGRPDRPRL